MRQALVVAAAALALLVNPIAPANAAFVTVGSNGSPDLSTMVVYNTANAVVVKLFCAGGKKTVRWSFVQLKGTDGVYEAKDPLVRQSLDQEPLQGRNLGSLRCPYVRVEPNRGVLAGVRARTCLGRLTNNVKAYTEHVATSPTPGTAGCSPWVTRG